MAGVKSGRPNVVTPLFFDQFGSAMLCEKCGQGIDAGPLTKLTPAQLASDIRKAMEDDAMVRIAAELGEKLRAKNGLKSATDVVTKFLRDNVASGMYWQDFDKFIAQKKARRKTGFLSNYFSCAPCVNSEANVELV